jgi:hypothetical protein
MPSVFLSHNSADKPFVRRLAKRLAESGIIVWLDEAQLHVGDSLIHKISEAIRDIDFIAVIISANSIKSPWVQKEIGLAVTKEIQSRSAMVLPIRIDDCEVPASLIDKVYLDFRRPRQFERQCKALLETMGVKVSREGLSKGIFVEWTDEGPRIGGQGVIISPVESNALLDRWNKWIGEYSTEAHKDTGDIRAMKVTFLATREAFTSTYNRFPDESELRANKTEMAHKYWVFNYFVAEMFLKYMPKDYGV